MALLTAVRLLGAVALLSAATGATAAPYLLGDISPERAHAEPQVVTETAVAGETAVFGIGPSGGGSSTIWRTDGTTEGTFPLHAGRHELREAILATVDGIVFFTHDLGGSALELWRTDGTLGGTGRLAVLTRGWDDDVWEHVELDGRLFLAACAYTCTLWVTDGTEPGTVPLTDFRPRYDDDSEPQLGLAVRDRMVLLRVTTPDRQHEVWQTDGTPAGTFRVMDADHPFWPPYACVPGRIHSSYGEATGYELWTCDAATGAPRLVADINPGPGSSDPGWFGGWSRTMNGGVLFAAFEPTAGRELWRSDGTEAGTLRLADLNPGAADSDPWFLGSAGGSLLFAAVGSSGGRQLWLSDGTPDGTVPLHDMSYYPGVLVPGPNSTLLFTASDPTAGGELWRTDGTLAGTVRLADANGGPGSSDPTSFFNLPDETLLFTTVGPTGARDLWRTDGTAAGTARLCAFDGSPAEPRSRALTTMEGVLLFTACDEEGRCTLWRTDGTAVGTAILGDLGTQGPDITRDWRAGGVVRVGDAIVFPGYTPGGTLQLWRTDATREGTALVTELPPLVQLYNDGSQPSHPTAVGDTIFFIASAPDTGPALWKTDGTSDGTVPVTNLSPGAYSYFGNLVEVEGTLFFSQRANHTTWLWKSDGTAAGTVPVAAPMATYPDYMWDGPTNVDGKGLLHGASRPRPRRTVDVRRHRCRDRQGEGSLAGHARASRPRRHRPLREPAWRPCRALADR